MPPDLAFGPSNEAGESTAYPFRQPVGPRPAGHFRQESAGNVLHAAARRQSAEFATGRAREAVQVPVPWMVGEEWGAPIPLGS